MFEVVAIQKVFSGFGRMSPSHKSPTSLHPEKTQSQELNNRSHFLLFSSPIPLIVVRMMPLKAIQLGLC